MRVVVFVVLVAACNKSAATCEKFVDLVAKCEGTTEDRETALKWCSAFEDTEAKDKTDVFIKKMHQCATTTTECAAFEDCQAGLGAEKAGAPAPAVIEGTKTMAELTDALTAAIGATKDCDAQTKIVHDTLVAKASQVTRLRTLMIDRKTQSAIAKSDRTDRATKKFKTATVCGPPLQAYADAFANIDLPPRPTSLAGPKASDDDCHLGAGMFAKLATSYSSTPEPMNTKIVDAMVKRCLTDGWTKEIADCYKDTTDVQKIAYCDLMLTKPLSDSLAADLKVVYGQ